MWLTLIAVHLAVWLGPNVQPPAATGARPERLLELTERVLVPEDGLLLDNGELSVSSAYQTADCLAWRLGKGDARARRLDLSDDPPPALIEEIGPSLQRLYASDVLNHRENLPSRMEYPAMESVNRRKFLDRSRKSIVGLAGSMPLLANSMVAHAAPDAPKRRPTVMCVYYPHWHNYDHGSAWKGEGWTEWEGVKAAVPRFPGHHQPLKPTWGYFDESDPKWAAREIDLAANHGIDVFLFDWYWYSGVQNMQEALEQGFLRAENRDRMKFALMWANHDRKDQFCPEFGKERTVWLPSRHSPRDLERMLDYCVVHYFRQPGYWRVEGRLFFSIYQAAKFVEQLGGPLETRKLLQKTDDRLRQAGLPPMHWNGMVADPKSAAILPEAGFQSTSRYNVNSAGKAGPDLTERYEDLMQAHRDHWQKMTSSAPLVNLPVVTTGWDATPRCAKDVPWPFSAAPTSRRHDYPYVPVVVGNTPERFEQLLRDAERHVKGDPRQPFAVLINAWNEWTEGCYLLPEERTGTACLEAILRTFGMASR